MLTKILITLCLFLGLKGFATSTIKVGGYIFPPFVMSEENIQRGLTLQIIQLMNKIQKKFKFEFIQTSSNRRYKDFTKKKFDIMLFENKKWGWNSYPVENTSTFLKGGEVYITQKTPHRDQNYFNNLIGKSFRGYIGYHYTFSNYITDHDILKSKYNMTTTRSHSGNIKSIIKGRADIAIVTKSYLPIYFGDNPSDKDKIIISKKFDQKYQHSIIFRTNGKITKMELENILTKLKNNNTFNSLINQYK